MGFPARRSALVLALALAVPSCSGAVAVGAMVDSTIRNKTGRGDGCPRGFAVIGAISDVAMASVIIAIDHADGGDLGAISAVGVGLVGVDAIAGAWLFRSACR